METSQMDEVDTGDLCGGFAKNYEARIREQSHVQALIEATSGALQELIDVEIERLDGSLHRVMLSRCGFIDPEVTMFTTPNPDVLGVRYGSTYLVDTLGRAEPQLLCEFRYLSHILADRSNNRMFLALGGTVLCVGTAGVVWESGSVGFEFITRFEYASGVVQGEGEGVFDDIPFELDADNGAILRGGFPPDT
jgi:hypothetical protein